MDSTSGENWGIHKFRKRKTLRKMMAHLKIIEHI